MIQVVTCLLFPLDTTLEDFNSRKILIDPPVIKIPLMTADGRWEGSQHKLKVVLERGRGAMVLGVFQQRVEAHTHLKGEEIVWLRGGGCSLWGLCSTFRREDLCRKI